MPTTLLITNIRSSAPPGALQQGQALRSSPIRPPRGPRSPRVSPASTSPDPSRNPALLIRTYGVFKRAGPSRVFCFFHLSSNQIFTDIQRFSTPNRSTPCRRSGQSPESSTRRSSAPTAKVQALRDERTLRIRTAQRLEDGAAIKFLYYDHSLASVQQYWQQVLTLPSFHIPPGLSTRPSQGPSRA